MTKYKLEDGGMLAAASPKDFVKAMRESSQFDNHGTDEEYMKRFANRYKTQTGEEIKTDDPETFLSELLRLGFAQKME